MDGKIGEGRFLSFSFYADITLASSRRSVENFSRKGFAAFTAQYYVESPGSQKRALGSHEIVDRPSGEAFRTALHHLKIYPDIGGPASRRRCSGHAFLAAFETLSELSFRAKGEKSFLHLFWPGMTGSPW
jgi:hypothetical protein